jgi:hypothetical protein
VKLRIKGNSLRLRVLQPELAKFLDSGRIEEMIQFTPKEDANLTYTLGHDRSTSSIAVRYADRAIAVVLPTAEAESWAKSDQVGIYASFDLGSKGRLEVSVEKDFACLDLSDAENEDTFPHPSAGTAC